MHWQIVLLHQTNSNLSGSIIELCSVMKFSSHFIPWINPFHIPLAYWRMFYEHRAISIIFHWIVSICHRNILGSWSGCWGTTDLTSPEGLWNMVTGFQGVSGEFLYCNYRISTFYSTGFNRIQPDSPSSNQFLVHSILFIHANGE